ncbi:hypothetical protein FFI97_022805 [Variovorax sp. KBS0712]|uniref:enolase C-terminal domain-like protein n=1 Tax=Variovorax sp. KBS0712 TaxID=2578111 RepID=UPI00111B2AF9|nr:enolase C-terminal domain-like protein [Variovorax sp. KBS0712]TSD56997.1 hypothetical protein FFI97_022805 [Variovorax sp. KBS0712]
MKPLHWSASLQGIGPARRCCITLRGGRTNTELVKVRALCEAEGIEFFPHFALFGPGQLATLHLNAATRSTPIFERLYCDFEEDLLEERQCR